ncbi:hypothetical protein R6242_07705 [Iodobacter sp. CM08]|uniref:hypothetical protein n=1 Tax=Iodobacter sp. CM08 TaxID=3085902 RepID=UPI002981519C|nr:hypothetical protein [Iodobacter sp. CM08]MDW5416457.1 hypothetical protein [Iodobacter sp. CM08]
MSDYPAAAQNGATTLSGLYPVNQTNAVKGFLEDNIAAFEAAAAKFAENCIHDGIERQNYSKNIKRISQQIREDVANGKMSVKQGAEFSQTMRNRIMEELRVASSPVGKSFAKSLKKEGTSMQVLLDKYADGIFKKPYSALTSVEKNKIYYAVIEASGRSSARVNAVTSRLRLLGKVCLLVTAGYAIYSIGKAENKEKEAITQGTVIGAGLAGGWAAGLAVTAICGPAAPFCAVAVVLVGAMAAGAAADATLSAYDEELEEFTKWDVR